MRNQNSKRNPSARSNKHKTSIYKKPWFAAGAIIMVFIIALSIGVNALWNNTLGQVRFVSAENKNKNLDLSNLTPEELELIEGESLPVTPYDKDVTNILLLGIDSRDPNKVDERSDAMMILTVNKTQGKVKLTSLQRDMLVEMPGRDMMDKLNHANSYGGPEYAVKTVNNMLRLDIDRYVVINMRGLEKLVDLLGGIEIDVGEETIEFVNLNIDETNSVFSDTPQSPHIHSAGLQTLNGRQAVGYARNRSTAGGDYDRMSYQQEVLQGIFNKFLTVGSGQKFSLLKEGFGLVTTNLSSEEILGMVSSVLPLLDKKIETLTIPITGYHVHYSGAAWLNLCDFNGMIPLIQKFIFGRTFDFTPVAEIPGAPNSSTPIEETPQIDEWVTPDETDQYGNPYIQEPDIDVGYPNNSGTVEETPEYDPSNEQSEPTTPPNITEPTISPTEEQETSENPSSIPPESSLDNTTGNSVQGG